MIVITGCVALFFLVKWLVSHGVPMEPQAKSRAERRGGKSGHTGKRREAKPNYHNPRVKGVQQW